VSQRTATVFRIIELRVLAEVGFLLRGVYHLATARREALHSFPWQGTIIGRALCTT
jgi:hypothetical protein